MMMSTPLAWSGGGGLGGRGGVGTPAARSILSARQISRSVCGPPTCCYSVLFLRNQSGRNASQRVRPIWRGLHG